MKGLCSFLCLYFRVENPGGLTCASVLSCSKKKYVAIKILRADRSVNSEATAEITNENAGGNTVKKVVHEHHVFKRLQKIDSVKCAKYITQLLEVFQHIGPNGVHTCLVFEPMAASVDEVEETQDEVIDRLLDPLSKRLIETRPRSRFPFWMARRILKQCLEGLAFLHENNMAHGDLHQGSLMFVLSKTNELTAQITGPPPTHTAVSEPLTAYADTTSEFRIKLSDLDSGMQCPWLPASPSPLVLSSFLLIDPCTCLLY